MPREIDKCPQCGNIEQLVNYKRDFNYKWCEYCEKPFLEKECSATIYTESEVQELIKKEREECALICEKMFAKWESYSQLPILKECAEAIRQRGKG